MVINEVIDDLVGQIDFFIVVLVYCSEKILVVFVVVIDVVIGGCYLLELIFVNDRSLDDFWKVVSELVIIYSWVWVVNLCKNVGQYMVIFVGLCECWG